MNWIAGFHPRVQGARLAYCPRAGRKLASRVWTTGYDEASQRTVDDGHDSLTVVGYCLATDDELLRGLAAARAQRWRDVMMWPGAYVVVAHVGGCATVLGSLSGTSRIYYTDVEAGWVWANAATPLAALGAAEIDYRLLVADMAVGGVEFEPSPFKGVHSVPPGSYLTFGPEGPRVVLWYEPSCSLTFCEGAELLRVRLLDAIDRRGEALAFASGDFSGGFDSSTLMFLVSRLCRVTGVTYTDRWIGNDDLAHARAIAQQVPAISHRIIEGGAEDLEYAGLTCLAEIPATDLPSTDLTVIARDRRMLSLAAALGSTHHFNGEGGDALLDASRMGYADQFLAGQRLQSLRGAAAYARRTRSSPAKMSQAVVHLARITQAKARLELVRSLRRQSWRQGALTRYDTLSWCLALPSAAWLSDVALSGVTELVEGAAQASPTFGPGQYHDWLGVRYTARNSVSVVAVAESMGLRYDMPFLDTALVDACLSVPGYERMSLTQFKPLLLAAIPELPLALRQRTTKGSFDASLAQGVRRAAPWLRQLVDESQLVALGWLSGEAVAAQLEREIAGLEVPSLALQQLVTRELWLRYVNPKLDSWWEVHG